MTPKPPAPTDKAIQVFMEARGYRWQADDIGAYWQGQGALGVTDEVARHWYATTAEALRPVEHDTICRESRNSFSGRCCCHADQINELLASRRKEILG